ncbi:MAG TPA: hypothetical protein ENI33_08120 [Thermoplasmatales archaeon]|nr:hypothetical protein [Thermoplasmatales archaeon]
MTKGMGRMAFDLGSTSIHVVSALSIDNVLIARGKEKAIEIIIEMSNSSGVFHVEKTLGKKVVGSSMEKYIDTTAMVTPAELDYDKRIVRRIKLKGRKFTAI